MSAFDVSKFGFAEHNGVLHQSGRRLAQHHPARWSDRFHPLCQPDMFTNRGVTECTRTELTGDHLARIQAYPQAKADAVPSLA